MGQNPKEIDIIKISEQNFPSINLKRRIYQSPRIRIVTDIEGDERSRMGFPRDDLPFYV